MITQKSKDKNMAPPPSCSIWERVFLVFINWGEYVCPDPSTLSFHFTLNATNILPILNSIIYLLQSPPRV